MAGHSFPEIACSICAKPVRLEADLNADENGRIVHEDCYVSRLTARPNQTTAEKLLAMLSAQPPVLHCPKCGSTLLQLLEVMFFLEGGKSCTVPIPVCQHCCHDDGAPLHMDA